MLQYRFCCMYISGCVENVAIQPPFKGKNSQSNDKPHLFSVTNLHLFYTLFIFGQDIYLSETTVKYNFQVITELQKLTYALHK
jgi:hypothetical protein